MRRAPPTTSRMPARQRVASSASRQKKNGSAGRWRAASARGESGATGPISTEARRRSLHPHAFTVNWLVLSWLLGRLLALGVLLGSLWLLYDAATSPQFEAARLLINGQQLAAPSQIEAAAAVGGQNLFWLRPKEIATRIEALPPVAEANVDVVLPDTVRVRVREKTPVAIWETGDTRFLVDITGTILATAADSPSLPSVRDMSPQALRPGGRVDADALKAATELARMLPARDGGPAAFEYLPGVGIEVPDLDGLRVRFGSSGQLSRKLLALQAIRSQLTQTGTSATFVDVRSSERPYYR